MSEPRQTDLPRVAILMATYNGGRFIDEQLASLAGQSGADLTLFVSDDGSSDDTLEHIRAFPQDRIAIEILPDRPHLGFAENFRRLIQDVPDGFDAYGFCDQDDVWVETKIARSLEALTDATSTAHPGLFCSRTRFIDAAGNPGGASRLFTRPPCFRNALVQSIAGANTMVMNRAAFHLVRDGCRDIGFVSPDWWSYLIVSAAGGTVVYDPEPQVLYRQHAGNAVGANTSIRAQLSRLGGGLDGVFRRWTDRNIEILEANRDRFTPEALKTFDIFKASRHGWSPMRFVRLLRSGVFRQSWRGQIGLWVAFALNRL